jgi:ribonuclease P protein component
MTADGRFPRIARVRARADFDRIFAEGRRQAGPLLALHWLREPRPPRLGLAVSRKVDPRAVVRNRIKRALRERFRRQRARLAPGSYVLVARAPAASADARSLHEAFDQLLARAGALLPQDVAGTMPGVPSLPVPPPPPRAG